VGAYVDADARLFGDVRLNTGTSLWPFAVIRAETHSVDIGSFSNIQDHAVLHVGYQAGVRVGRYCSVAHRATLHGCTIGDACLVGIGATVMDGADIGAGSIVAPHSLVRENMQVPAGSIVAGVPAQVIKSRDSTIPNVMNALLYHRNALAYAKGNHRAWTSIDSQELRTRAEAIAAELAD
jgi:carbonic anhydrase/acetyltransferase-like protein (isoleucine patch superfamily)